MAARRSAARLDYGAHEQLMAAFPFPHELHVQAELRHDTLTVVTILLPTGDVAVPVSFGWHPYLCLPGVPRSEWRVELPVRRRALLDDRGLPTGETRGRSTSSRARSVTAPTTTSSSRSTDRPCSRSRAAAGGSRSSWGRATRSGRSSRPPS